MKKNTILTISLVAIGLLAISLITINTKKAYADNIADPIYEIGAVVKDFSLKNYDGAEVNLASVANAKGVILVFTCNTCPFAKAYQSRVQALHKKYEGLGYPLLAVNPNSTGASADESMAANAQTVKNHGFTFKYVADEKQEQAKLFGAKKTPTAYILQKVNDTLVLKYAGAIDDSAQDEEGISKKYVETALAELLVGRSVSTSTTKSIGCGIKWKSAL